MYLQMDYHARGNVVSREMHGGVLEFFIVDERSPILDFCERVCERCEAPGSDLCERCNDEVVGAVRNLERNEEKVLFYKSYAEGRGLSWHLSMEEALLMLTQPCSLCGSDGEGRCIGRLTQGNYQYDFYPFFCCLFDVFTYHARKTWKCVSRLCHVQFDST